MARKVVKYYRLTSKSGKLLAKLQAEMQAYFHKLEEAEHDEEIAAGMRDALSFEEALRNEKLDAAAMEAESDFAVIYFKQVSGGILRKKEVDLVLKGTASRLRRAEVYISQQNCTLSRPKIVTKAIFIFRINSFTKEVLKNLKEVLTESCPNVTIKHDNDPSIIDGTVSGDVEGVLIARDLFENSSGLQLTRSHITFL